MMLPVRRSLAGVAAVLLLAAGTAGGAHAAPVDDRDDQVSRDDGRPALAPAVAQALAQRRDALRAASVEIAVAERTLRVKEIAKARAKVEADARYAEKVKALGYDPKTSDPRDIARQMMLNDYEWGEEQFACYDRIITQESNWRWNADNPTSSAYGIPQALPGSKMASAGADWRTNPATQIKWGLKYVQDRYGTPCEAWTFKRARGWY